MRTAIVERPLDPGALLREVADTANGAALLFVGTVRETNEGRAVTGIDYSAYLPMAERELAAIVREAVERFGTPHIVAEHRLGALALGEPSVAIAVAHPRRAPAYEASRWVVEELKRRVPVWKREHYADGTREWVDPTREVHAAVPGAGRAADPVDRGDPGDRDDARVQGDTGVPGGSGESGVAVAPRSPAPAAAAGAPPRWEVASGVADQRDRTDAGRIAGAQAEVRR